ncbi:MAG: hypothetical protein R3E66_09540 [bacterium]
MKFETHIEHKVLIVRASKAGRFEQAAARTLTILPWSVGITVIFFAIEWTGGMITQTAQPSWVYGFLGVTLGVLVALIFGISRGLRNDLWAFDLQDNVVAWESRMPWGQLRTVQVPLAELRRIERVRNGTAVEMVFEGDHREELCRTKDAESIAKVYDALKRHLGKAVEWS